MAQSNGSVSVVHLDNGEVVSFGTGEALSDELVDHGSGIEPSGEDSDVSEEVISSSKVKVGVLRPVQQPGYPVQVPQTQILMVMSVMLLTLQFQHQGGLQG